MAFARSKSRPIVVVGAGGIGAPLVWALAEAGVESVTIIDEDHVELGNLHRQILFRDEDVGRSKVLAMRDALVRDYPTLSVEVVESRAVPETVERLLGGAAAVVDATDNYPTRFLLADAAHLGGVPIVHAAAVRWQATVMTASAGGGPCYRCLFEDIPQGVKIDCSTAGVAGPVCGVAGALAADRVLRLLDGDATVLGSIVTYDGVSDSLREVAVHARSECPLCGIARSITRIDSARYERTARSAMAEGEAID